MTLACFLYNYGASSDNEFGMSRSSGQIYKKCMVIVRFACPDLRALAEKVPSSSFIKLEYSILIFN